MILSRDQILNCVDLNTETVEVPEWGGSVIVRGMSGAERDSLESEMIEQTGKNVNLKYDNLRAKLVARCVVDESGNRLFTDDDISLLGTKSAAALNRVFEVAQKLSGIGIDDVKELVKN